MPHPDPTTDSDVATSPGRPPVLVVLAAAAVAGIALLVVAGGGLAPYDPAHQDLMRGAAGPGDGHWLGTDSLGRDVLSQVVAGTRTAVVGPLCVAIGVLLLGVPLGVAAGYRGGLLDAVVNRFADLIYAFPAMLLVIVVVGVIGTGDGGDGGVGDGGTGQGLDSQWLGGYWLAVAVLTLLSLPAQIRLCRNTTLVQARLPYVEAARTLGLSAPRIMFRHILPNILPTVLATFLLDFVGALIGLSGLSYLGLGVPPGTPDWGELLRQGQSLLTVNPYLSLAPGLMIIITAVGVTLLGDWMYDRRTAGTDRR
ncbi:ABC transporter permease [Streptomyces ipomoeae]|uniref:ABC transporter permease n=1 Tax=Streptomyces ipomoeae TaxID=103232 RepID=UPI0029A23EC4|nr:ABC transporter permease [Streptomyces ipomoeae]MDX2876704.1 ABC transporter permease [Streptomyces ipomoeae]